MSTKPKIAILGCGPAGLLSGLAYMQEGCTVTVFTQDIRKSPIGGAQFLHECIHGLTPETPEGQIQFLKRGSARGYAAKVYGGRVPVARTSWNAYPEGSVHAWSLQAAYDRLWSLFGGRMVTKKVDYFSLKKMVDSKVYDRIVSTIPRSATCGYGKHEFSSSKIWVSPMLPVNLPANTIIYSGRDEDPWQRLSNVFGYTSAEYTSQFSKKLPMFCIDKPLDTDCDCWEDEITFAGRFGKWQKGVLVHHAYQEAVKDAGNLQPV